MTGRGVSKTVGVLWKFQNVLPRTSKLLIRPQLGHGDIIHDPEYNFTFHKKLKSFQCNASLTMKRQHQANSQRKTLPVTGP